MILFLVSYYFSMKVESQKSFLSLNAFGFLVNGKFEFNFINTQNQQLYVGLATPNELSYLSSTILNYDNFTCISIKQIIYIKLSELVNISQEGSGFFNGTVNDKNYYTPIIISCTSINRNAPTSFNNINSNINPNQNKFSLQNKSPKSTQYASYYTFSIKFSNPNSLLDSRKIPCLYIKPISTALFGLLILFWIINWVLNFTLKNPLHLYLTATFLVTFLFVIIDTLKLYHDNISDEATSLTTACIVLRCFHELLLLTAMMLAAKGWCIIIETISISEIVSSVLYAVMFSIPILILDIEMMNVYLQLSMFLVGFAGCFLYYNVLISSIAEANSVVSAHLLLISQSGIDPETTPIQKKYHIFNTISNSVVLYFSIMMFRTVLFELLYIPDYFMASIYDFATFALLAIAAWLFKLKKSLRTGYMMVGENAESVEFTLDDIEKLNEDKEELQKSATTPWQEGMPLPAQPILTKGNNKNSNNNNIDDVNSNQKEYNTLDLDDNQKDKNEPTDNNKI